MTRPAAAAQRMAVSVIRGAVNASGALYAAQANPDFQLGDTQTELTEMAANLERIGDRVRAESRLFVERQLKALGVGPGSRGLRLHLGARARVEQSLGLALIIRMRSYASI
jgi:hypothetical protein